MNYIYYICNYAFQLTYWVGALLNIANLRQGKMANLVGKDVQTSAKGEPVELSTRGRGNMQE